MSAPATTARGTPLGYALKDGHSTKIAFAADPTISFWEKDVQAPGMDAGAKVDTTTMYNVRYKTAAPSQLAESTDIVTTVAYDPAAYESVLAILAVETSITITFSDGSTLDFYGYLAKFIPDSAAAGKQPEAKVTIIVTNWDSVAGVEQGPVYTAYAGT